jgi:hypothetical protein
MGVVILPLLIVWWWRRGRQSSLNLPDLVASTLLLSLISAPFGWSFDVIIFLVPLLQLLLWMIEGKIAQHRSLAILLLFVAANGVTLYQRSLQLRDDYFFWFPIVMACLYWWGWLSLRESSLRVQGKVISRPYG